MKKNHDTLQRFIFENTSVRGNLIQLTHTLEDALHQQRLPFLLKKALGELMAASALLSATLKMQGSLIMQIQSQGLLKLLVVECTTHADGGIKMRATAKCSDDISDQQDVFELIEHGQFMMTLDPKDGKQIYQGIVPIEGASMSDVLENYMRRSEQIDTKIWLTCDGNIAAGMLIQKLPKTMSDTTPPDDDAWNRVCHLADTITHDELLQLPSNTLLKRLFHQEDIRIFEPNMVQFYCSCSRESVSNMLRMLGEIELNDILKEQGKIEVNCDFCNTHYSFDEVDAAHLLISEVNLANSPNVH